MVEPYRGNVEIRARKNTKVKRRVEKRKEEMR